MPLFLCRWPNATVSIVEAEDPADAVMQLDDMASADTAWIQPFQIRNFHIELVLDDHGKLILHHMEDGVETAIKEIAFPILAAAEKQVARERGEYISAIEEAIRREEKRVPS
jgi:hypothetical protein